MRQSEPLYHVTPCEWQEGLNATHYNDLPLRSRLTPLNEPSKVTHDMCLFKGDIMALDRKL